MSPETSPACFSGLRTGMAQAVFSEVADRLVNLHQQGTESDIDLRSLPLTNADLEELEALLGNGEVKADLNVIGMTSIRETSFAGVWWVRHFGANNQVATEQISITPLPEILRAHPDDITEAADRIRQELDLVSGNDTLKECQHG